MLLISISVKGFQKRSIMYYSKKFTMKVHLILALFCAVYCQDSSLYHLHYLSTMNGASCLDASPPAVYVHQGFGENKNKLLLFFGNGGFCSGYTFIETLEQCYQQSLKDSGSTRNLPFAKSFKGQGILSTLKEENPNFYDWTKVYLISCDGTAFLGSRDEPSWRRNSKLYFRGEQNAKEALKYLSNNYNLSQKEKVVVAGVQSGGIAALAYSNYIYDNYKSSQVFILSDSSIFLPDFKSLVSNTSIFRLRTSELAKLVLNFPHTSAPLQNCFAANMINDRVKCFSPIHYISGLKPHVMIIESGYNSDRIANIIKAKCLSSTKPYFLSECSRSENQAIEAYKIQIQSHLMGQLKLWSTSCIEHAFLDNPRFSNPSYTAGGVPLSSAVAQFLENPLGIKNMVDNSWQLNTACNGLPQQQQCFVNKTFEFNIKQQFPAIIYKNKFIFQGCNSTFQEYSISIDRNQPENPRINFQKVASAYCEDNIISTYEKAIRESATFSIVSTQQDQELQMLNQNGKMVAYLILRKQKGHQKINSMNLQGFYMLYLPPLTLAFSSTEFAITDVCKQTSGEYTFHNGTLQLTITGSNLSCSDLYIMYIRYLINLNYRLRLDSSTCSLEQFPPYSKKDYTFVAKLAEEKNQDDKTDEGDKTEEVDNNLKNLILSMPDSLTGSYVFSLFGSDQVAASFSETMFEFQGCQRVGSRYFVSNFNRLEFGSFYSYDQKQCQTNHDYDYVLQIQKTKQFKFDPTGLQLMNENGKVLVTLRKRV